MIRSLSLSSNLRSDFAKGVITLITGTTIAQALPIVIGPILTRLYSPSDFGVLALYIALTALISVVATGRYEMAIVLSKNDEDSFSLAILTMLISAIISSVVFLTVCFFSSQISYFLGNKNIQGWLYILPLSIFLAGFYQVMNYWCTRNRNYKQLSVSRIVQNGGASVVQSALGCGLNIPGGLIVGLILGYIFSIVILIKFNFKVFLSLFQTVTYLRIIKNAREYKNFPLFSIWGALLDTASVQAPLFIISMFFCPSITGAFSFSFKILTIPMVLISNSIAQVLFHKINQIHNEKPEDMFFYIFKIFVFLSITCLPFLSVFIMFGKEFFTFVFGKDWAMAGEFASILSLSAGVRFIISPLSVLLYLNHNVKKATIWQLCYFMLTMTLFFYTDKTIDVFIKIFVFYELTMYSVYLLMIFSAARSKNKRSSPITNYSLNKIEREYTCVES